MWSPLAQDKVNFFQVILFTVFEHEFRTIILIKDNYSKIKALKQKEFYDRKSRFETDPLSYSSEWRHFIILCTNFCHIQSLIAQNTKLITYWLLLIYSFQLTLFVSRANKLSKIKTIWKKYRILIFLSFFFFVCLFV